MSAGAVYDRYSRRQVEIWISTSESWNREFEHYVETHPRRDYLYYDELVNGFMEEYHDAIVTDMDVAYANAATVMRRNSYA